MWQFVKYSLATLFGLFLFFIVSLLLLAGVGAAIGSSDEVFDLKDNSVLRLDLNRPIVENASTEDNPFSSYRRYLGYCASTDTYKPASVEA
jgi:protease-4